VRVTMIASHDIHGQKRVPATRWRRETFAAAERYGIH